MTEEINNLINKPPVVVILGHIDHGKSSILEAIKDLKITEKESGGITQHIGAYEIEHHNKKITFIDTPGHEAFSAIRSRGAKVADIAILVIAADEGVKAQTKEAIDLIKRAGLPLIVSINKIDKPGANPEKVKRELAKGGILVESAGGEVPSVEVSAKTGQGITDLLELVHLVAEMENLKADISLPAEGVIIEAYLDSKRGPTATIILNNGILKRGDIIGTSSCIGKVRLLEDFQGRQIEKAMPSMPVVIFGFEDVPKIGEKVRLFANLKEAEDNLRPAEEKVSSVISVNPGQKILNLILRTDVLGSAEAIEEVLKELPQEKIVLRILKSKVGEIDESDVKLAKSANARILGFRVKVNRIAENLARREKVKIMIFDVIYDLAEGIRKLMEKIVGPEIVRVDIGKVKILAVFRREKNRQILGGKVIEGRAEAKVSVEVLRNGEVVDRGKIINLQRNKKDTEKVLKGEECGILYEGNIKIEEGDVLNFYTEEKIKA